MDAKYDYVVDGATIDISWQNSLRLEMYFAPLIHKLQKSITSIDRFTEQLIIIFKIKFKHMENITQIIYLPTFI